MSRSLVLALVAGGLSALVLALPGCSRPGSKPAAGAAPAPVQAGSKLQLPTVEARESAITEQTGAGTTVTFDVLVSNPFPTPLPLESTAYAVSIEGRPIAQGRQDLRVKNVPVMVAAGKSQVVQVPVRVKPDEVLAALSGSRGGDLVAFEADLFVMADTPTAGPVTLSTKGTGSVPLPPAMAVEAQGVLFEAAGGPGDAWVGLAMTNRNSGEVTLQSVTVEIVLSGKISATGSAAVGDTIASGAQAEINIPLAIRPALAAGAKPKPGDVISYEIKGSVTASSARGVVTMPLAASGKVRVVE